METAVSVIIATYNRRAMVAEAIASVVAQREVCAELIVVDDGSTDATAETLARIAGEVRAGAGGVAMRIIAHREKRGVAAARNTGVALASAPIVAFLDSDDPWVIRRAGHAGQLSASVPAIDRFRILSLLKLLAHSDDLSLEQRAAVCAVLAEKSRILAKGLSRRGNDDLAERIERLSVQAPNWIVGADPQLHHELATLRPLLTTTRRIEENRNDFHGF